MARKSRKKNQIDVTEKKESQKHYAAIYARLSVEDTNLDNSSIENQILMVEKYMETHKDLIFIDTYIDNGQTGTNFHRPAFFRLMQDLEKGRVNCILVKDLSRFGRNYLETGNYLENIFPKNGVRFISVNDNFDSLLADHQNGLMVSLKSILHDSYAKDISRKVSTAIDVKKKNGKFMNRIPPYGYVQSKTDPYKLEIENEQAEAIRSIFRWRIEGVGPTAIARKLNEMCVPTQMRLRFLEGFPDGKESALWHGSTVTNILKNPCYMGCLVERKTQKALYKGGMKDVIPPIEWNIIEDTHTPIISREIFYAVQDILKQSALQKKNDASKYAHRQRTENVFRGLLFCGACGSALQRDGGYYRKDGTLAGHFFNCPRKYLKKGRCTAHSIREDKIKEVVLQICKRHLLLLIDSGGITLLENAEKFNGEICRLFIEKITVTNNHFCISFPYQFEFDKAIEGN